MYKVLANINNILVKEIELTANFQPNVSSILKAVNKNTKLIFICSPNNPTGNLINSENIKILLINFNGIVIIDEAYIDFANSKSWINSLKTYPNLIVTQTLSKAYGMAGIRLGMCFASPKIIALLNKIKPPYNVNTLTQNQALKQLSNIIETKKKIEVLLNERNELANSLSKIKFVENIYPSNANFILVKVDDATKRYKQLIAKNMVVRNRTNQPLCTNTLRFTVGTPPENSKLLNVLKEIEND